MIYHLALYYILQIQVYLNTKTITNLYRLYYHYYPYKDKNIHLNKPTYFYLAQEGDIEGLVQSRKIEFIIN